MSRHRQTPNKKVSVAPALKAAGQAQDQASTTALETAELSQGMTDSCASKLDDLGNRQALTASRAPIERFLVDGPVKITVRALERPYTTSYFLPRKVNLCSS